MNFRTLRRKVRTLERLSATVPCTCRPRTSTLDYSTRTFAFKYARTSFHDPLCRRSSFQDVSSNVQLRASLFPCILRRRVSLSFTQFYGSGFTQSLQCHPIVQRYSGAFPSAYTLHKSSISMTKEEFRGEVDKLNKMFELRQASPHDRLPDGGTLLHVCTKTIFLMYQALTPA